MITIPEEFTLVQVEQFIPVDLLQDEYRKWYSKQIPGNAIAIIDKISQIADLKRGSNNDLRYNSIIFIKVCLKELPNENGSEIFREIAKGIFRAIPYQCFIIFRYQNKVKYCVSKFRPYINNERNNVVEELVISNWIKDLDNRQKNKNTDERINNLLTSSFSANGIYQQLYPIINDNYCDIVLPYESPYDRIIKDVGSETVPGTADPQEIISETYGKQITDPLTPGHQKQIKEYENLKEKADNDKTGESQYKFAQLNLPGHYLQRDLRKYAEYLVKAAENEYPQAIKELADYYYGKELRDDNKTLIFEKDFSKAYKLYRKILDTQELRNNFVKDEIDEMRNKAFDLIEKLKK